MQLKPAGLSWTETVAGFSVKVLLGCLYGFIYLHYYNGDDTWKIFDLSVRETSRLINDPASFFWREYTPMHAWQRAHGLSDFFHIYFADLEYALLIKTMAIANLVTRGNYYADVAVFNFIAFFGHYWMFKTLNERFPGRRKLFFLCIFFFLPAVFWLSGLRIDGLLFFFLSLFLMHLFRNGRVNFRRVGILILSFAGIFICRPELSLILLLATAGYCVSLVSRKPVLSYATVFATAIALFFISAVILPDGGLPGKIAQKQAVFLELKGTGFALHALTSTPAGFLRVLPQAIVNTFFRPFPWEAHGSLQMMAFGEIVVFWTVVVVAIVRRRHDWRFRLRDPVILFLLTFSITLYLMVGYIVPFPGAIVRYKAIAELLLVGCAVAFVKQRDPLDYKNI
jgi:hypothetical protein